jgi:hypothetical protein
MYESASSLSPAIAFNWFKIFASSTTPFDGTLRLCWRQELLRHSGAGSADTLLIGIRVNWTTPKLPEWSSVSTFNASVHFEWIDLMFACAHDGCGS